MKAQVDAGADVIKVYGSTGSGADVTGRQTLTYEEMKAIVDTAHFKGNYPDACSIQVADLGDAGESLDELVVASSMFWEEILPQQKLVADTIHEYGQNQIRQNGAVTHARFNIYPDGGVSRVRLFGKIARG